jgi:hypothetical protein
MSRPAPPAPKPSGIVLLDEPAIPFKVGLEHPTSAPAQLHALAYALSNGDGESFARFSSRLLALGWVLEPPDDPGPTP